MSEREELAYRRGRKCERDEFKNFHRLLCERFGYTHDEVDWKRDQISLIEWIARRTVSGQEAIYQVFDDGQWTDVEKPLFDCIEPEYRRILYAAPIPATELSDDDLRKLAFKHCYATTDANGWIFAAELDRGLRDFARAILAAKEPK